MTGIEIFPVTRPRIRTTSCRIYPSDRYEHNIKVIRFYCTYLFQNNRSGPDDLSGKLYPILHLVIKSIRLSTFHKYEINGKNKAAERRNMVPMQRLSFMDENKVNMIKVITSCITFNCIRLNGPPFSLKSQSISWYLATIFEQCYTPTKQYHTIKRPIIDNLHFLQFQMPIPSQCHKHIRNNK